MKKGERSVVTVKPDFGYGGVEVQTALAKIPPSSTLTYEVEMVDFAKVTHRILVKWQIYNYPHKAIYLFFYISLLSRKRNYMR